MVFLHDLYRCDSWSLTLKENTQMVDLILRTDAVSYIHTSVHKVVFIHIAFLSYFG